jgi:hypothetical protein
MVYCLSQRVLTNIYIADLVTVALNVTWFIRMIGAAHMD